MESIILRLTFALENGGSHVVTIRDVKEDVIESEMASLADSFIEKGSEYNGSKYVSIKKCEKIITNTQVFLTQS